MTYYSDKVLTVKFQVLYFSKEKVQWSYHFIQNFLSKPKARAKHKIKELFKLRQNECDG